MMFDTTWGRGVSRPRARALLRLIGLAATYQRPGMPVEHIPPVTTRTPPGHSEDVLG
jgi:hypothetical protein